MRRYTIKYLDGRSKTQSALEFQNFKDSKSAIAFARIGIARNAIVEVWRDNHLVKRLYRDAPPVYAPAAGQSEPWENEGGAQRPSQARL